MRRQIVSDQRWHVLDKKTSFLVPNFAKAAKLCWGSHYHKKCSDALGPQQFDFVSRLNRKSDIESKESALVWHHEDANPDFGSAQAKELFDHLESVLANEPVAVKKGQFIVEVKPQVRVVTDLSMS
ncbi:hypothetical protein Ancab_020163 [Ancistrocladus abbreviatus]